MQLDERVGVEPVAADAVPTVDDDHPRVGVVDQRVGERQAGGARADHEVVGLHTRVTGPPKHGGAGRTALSSYRPARRIAAAPDMARILPSALARGRYFMPQSVAMVILSGEV